MFLNVLGIATGSQKSLPFKHIEFNIGWRRGMIWWMVDSQLRIIVDQVTHCVKSLYSYVEKHMHNEHIHGIVNSFMRGKFTTAFSSHKDERYCGCCCEGKQHIAGKSYNRKMDWFIQGWSAISFYSPYLTRCVTHISHFTLSTAYSIFRHSTIQFMFTGLGDRSITSSLFVYFCAHFFSSRHSFFLCSVNRNRFDFVQKKM